MRPRGRSLKKLPDRSFSAFYAGKVDVDVARPRLCGLFGCILCGQSRCRCRHSAAVWLISIGYPALADKSWPLCRWVRSFPPFYAGKVDVDVVTLRPFGLFLYRPPPWPTKVGLSSRSCADFLHFMRVKLVACLGWASQSCLLEPPRAPGPDFRFWTACLRRDFSLFNF